MKKFLILISAICIFLSFFTTAIFAVKPFITSLYLADPSGHEFEGRLYVYPSHDEDDAGWFDMEDYHVFSSADLINWVDHGVVLSYKDIDWVAQPPLMWAPDCAYKNGVYFFYYPARNKYQPDEYIKDTFKIGVATGKSPSGPFIPVKYPGDTIENPIPGSFSIDPCVFIDETDNQAYMAFGGRDFGGLTDGPYLVKLNDNMTEFADGEAPQVIKKSDGYPLDDWFEGCWIHQRRDAYGKMWYYLSYATGYIDEYGSRIHYAMNDKISADGWVEKGEVIGDVEGNSIQQSFVKFKDDWFALFHTSDMSGGDTTKRSICIAKLEYNDDGTMQVVDQNSFNIISAYSRIKAMFCTAKSSGIHTDEDPELEDIGKTVGFIKNGDFISFDNVDFGSAGVNGFEARVASPNSGCTIEIRYGTSATTDPLTAPLIGTVSVPNTGSWNSWANASCDITSYRNLRNKIYLVFKGGSGYLLNLNWFTFKRAASIPIGYSISLKSLNPNCIDNKGNQGQKYLCVDDNYDKDLCANRASVGGPWEKFSILDGFVQRDNLIRLNSSNNGKNLMSIGKENPISASGGDYKTKINYEYLSWGLNDDGTISLRNMHNTKFLCVDTWYHGNNPAKVYDNRTTIDFAEKYYCEVGDAPIGCVVAFKSLNTHCNDEKGGSEGQKYLCIDNNNYGDLCCDRTGAQGEWEKFLVVDANNGYIALKSFNGNKYLHFDNNISNDYPNNPGKANTDTIDNNSRFQWRNNGDGTVSLKHVASQQYLCIDTTKGNSPAKCYANRSAIAEVENSWEKFYCQVIK